jgi:hypothetical protein
MKSPLTSARAGAFAALVCFFLLALASATTLARSGGDKDWKPVDPAQLKMTTLVVEKDADAEILFWEVHVNYQDSGGEPATVLNHYVRIKVFNDRGRESQSKVDIIAPSFRGRKIKIKDVAARTIKPDGTIVELKPEDVFERDVLKTNGVKVKAKSFALPSVEAGSIIEYRWREVRDGIQHYERFEFSRDIPVESVKYWIKPYGEELVNGEDKAVGLRAQTFHTNSVPFVREKDGSYSMTLANVPAYREEPRMPPEYAVRPWMLAYYSTDTPLDPDKFWRDYGRKVAVALKPMLKVNDDIRKASAEAVGDAQTPEQKLQRLYDFARAKVKRYTDDASGLTAEQRKKIKENKSPADTLKRGVGTGADIDLLFGALASAAGFDVHIACTSDRADIFFDKSFPDDYFIDPSSVAVKVGDQWRFFNPGSTYVTFGMLRWQEEGQETLISDEKEPVWVSSPVSGPEKSLEKRVAKLKLSDDGTLEGDVNIEYTGHLATDIKELNDDESQAQREERLKNRLKEQLGATEITDIRVENVTDPDKPFTYSFHVRVPGYAQRTGKRLFLQPAFFEKGIEPLFPTADRRQYVYFHFPWSEQDHVEVTLPEGYALDNPESPAPINAGLSKYEPRAMITKDGRTLVYERNFLFGQGGTNALLFPTTIYPNLKAYFDQVHKEDNHTIVLKQAATTAAASGSTSN